MNLQLITAEILNKTTTTGQRAGSILTRGGNTAQCRWGGSAGPLGQVRGGGGKKVREEGGREASPCPGPEPSFPLGPGGGGGAGHPGQAKVWASVVKDAAFSGGVCQPVRSAPTHPGGQGCELLVPQAPPKHPWKANWRITSDSPVGSPWRRRAEPVRERALSGG